MVRGRVHKSAASKTATSQTCTISTMKTRLPRQGKLRKEQQQRCITNYFNISSFALVSPRPPPECVLAANEPASKFCQEDYFEARYQDLLLATFEKPNEIQETEPKSLPGSPLHRIQLNADNEEALPVIISKVKKPQCNRQVTDFFPIRRSERKCKKTVQEEKQKSLKEQLKSGIEDGLKVQNFKEKGRGVVATKPFNRGDFVVEYSGELLDVNQAKRREEKYAQDVTAGCYMYYFKFQNRQYCIDATAESNRLGRLINHSRNGNLITRTVEVDTLPRLVLIAKDFVNIGEELCYDYGDRSKESLRNHPWLAL